MSKSFTYIQNFAAGDDTATILLYNRIGSYIDAEGVLHNGINGELFAQEIKYLNQQKNIKKINIRINSAGGSVFEGYSIISAILSSEKQVDTYIDGIAASIAGIIALCGKKVHMYDFGTLMIHNPFSSDESVSGDILSFIKATLVKIISNRTPRGEEEIAFMMDNETWMNSVDAFNGGFVDEVVRSNKDSIEVKGGNPYTIANVYETVLNEIIKEKNKSETINEQKQIKMKSITTLLNLSEGVDETVITDNIKKIQDELTATESELTEKDAEIAELKSKLEEANAKLNNAEVAKATELVENAITAGKIKEDAKESFIKLAVADYDSVKNSFEAINNSKKSVNILDSLKNLKSVDGRESWTIRDYEKKAPKELETIRKNTPEVYNLMYDEYYKK